MYGCENLYIARFCLDYEKQQNHLILTILWATSADDKLNINLPFVFKKLVFDISWKSSETICMECHTLFSGKN